MKNVASLLTQLADELLRDERGLINANIWIRLTITDTSVSDDQKDRYKASLKTIEDATDRIEDLLPKVKTALTKLRNVVVTSAKVDVDTTLKKVCVLSFTTLVSNCSHSAVLWELFLSL